ncbi:hypothetical protein JTE90_023619 [Oedothorax gibbosus]|uniref:Uncharacterized protein n=1 Tax=Oedothorax gibbosus TaxID=931172 RepID=A0AAV6U3V9_9ARAC|nr:hypothetical protein JTE90_023619 [Oedothorax gibbosus]
MSTSCPICFEPLEGKIRASPSICDHVFCMDCLQKWIKTDNVCPIDRKKFQKIINLDFNATIKVKPKKRKRQRVYYDVSVHCEVCKESTNAGVLLLCDSCDLAYHCKCLTPPVTEIPNIRWHCPVCVDVESRLRPTKTTRQKSSQVTPSSSSSSTKSSEKSEKKKRQKESHKNRKRKMDSCSPKFKETHNFVRRKQQSQRQAASKSLQIITNIIIEESMKEDDDDANDLMLSFNHQPGPSTSTDISLTIKDGPSVSSNTASNEEMEDADFQIGDSDFMDTSSDSESDDITKAIVSFHQEEKLSADDEISEDHFPSHLFQEDEYQDYDVSFEDTVEENSCNQELDNLDTNLILKENQEDSDDLQYPGVTDINPNIEEDEPEKEMEFEAEEIEEEEENFSEECEEEEEEIPEEEHNEGESLAQSGRHPSLRCRSIRIGSYTVHPRPTQPFVAVVLDEGRIAFNAPIISDPGGTQVHITLGSGDVHKMYFHFGRCLPVMFITTTPRFGELVRTALHMIENETPYFDPSTKDDKTQKLTFLIESISEQQKSFLKTKFAGDNKTIEIDQKTANEILVKSTPNQNAVLQLKRPDPVPTVSSEPRLPQISNQASEGKENSEQPQEQNTDFSTKQQDNLKLQSDMPVLVAISPLNNRIPNDKCNTEKLTLVHQQGHNKDSESQTSQVILENSVSNGYISQLQAENKRLHLLLASLNRHPVIEVSNPIKNLRKENKKLKDIQSKLRKEITELKLEAKMFPSFESKCDSIEKLVQDFKQSLESQQVDISNCIQLEHRLNSAMTESQNLHEIVDSSQQQIKNLKQNIEKNQKPSSAVGNLEHIPLEKEILSPIKENNQPKNAIETNSTSSSVSVMENIPFDGESSNLPCIIDPKLTLTCSKNCGGVPIISLCNVPSLSTSSRNDENDVQTVEQSPESSNTKHTLPSANDFDSSSTGKSFMRLQDADDNSTDSNFPDKAILLKLPLRLNFKRTPNNSPKQNAETVSSTSATANICKRISERATYLQDWNSKMAQPKNGLQTSHSNCDSLLSTSANNIKRPLSFSIPIAVSLTENQKDSKPLSSNVNNTDFCNFNNVSVGNYIGSDNLPSRTTSSGEKKTSNTVTSTFKSSSSGSEKTSPNASFVAIHRNDINHTKKSFKMQMTTLQIPTFQIKPFY